MSRIRSVTVVSLMIGLSAVFACGEAGQQEAAAGDMASGETSGSTAVAETQDTVAQQSDSLPEGVTVEMVAQGKDIFAGAGLCYACHGANGSGTPGLGPNLMDDEWLHSDGSYEGIVETVMNGVDASKSKTGTAMAAKGGSGITDDQVKAVAAYVYTLSH
jgi:mono/diheme cytochrome c family protein